MGDSFIVVGTRLGCFVGDVVCSFGIGLVTVESPAKGIENRVFSEEPNSPPLTITNPSFVLKE